MEKIYKVNVTETEIQKLQTMENSVYRKILGAPKFAQACTLRGEVGASSMKTRIREVAPLKIHQRNL